MVYTWVNIYQWYCQCDCVIIENKIGDLKKLRGESTGIMDTLLTERLIECRQKMGISKQEAARRIQVSQPAYLRYEAGARNPSIQTIEKMAEVFSTSVDYLLGKTMEAGADKILIDQSKTPSLFLLAETCRALNEDQMLRLIAYAEEMSDIQEE